MSQLTHQTPVTFYLKGMQCAKRFDMPSRFNKRYEGPLLNVLLHIDKDFHFGEHSKKIQKKTQFSKKFIGRLFTCIANISDDDNYIDQAFLTMVVDHNIKRINFVKKTKIMLTIVNCWE